MKKALPLLLTALLAACGGDNNDDPIAATSQPAPSSPAPSSAPAPTIPTTPTTTTATVTAAESTFLSEVVQSGTTTVQQAQATVQRTNNEQVRRFAQVLIDNHTQLNTTLAQIAQANSVALSTNTAGTGSTTTGATANTTTGNPSTATGTTPSANPTAAASNDELDRLFLQQSLQLQRQYVSRFQEQAAGATNTQVKSFAANALPLLQLQLLTAKELGASIDPAAYLQGAYEDGLGEIALANLAVQKTQDANVRAFAEMMVEHHTELNAQIQTLAQSEGVTLPAATALPIEHVLARDSIAQLSGADFNKAYMSHNVVVHLGDVNATQAQSTAGPDAEVRNLATAALPRLQAHLQEANEIYAAIQPSFLVAAYQNNVSEILLASLATPQRATNEAVRTFAQHMIGDHATQNTALAQLAAQENVILPNVLPAEGVIAYRTLLPKTGDDFNRSFTAENIRFHEIAVALFTDRSTNEPDPEQRAFAAATLPVLRTHLQEATQINTGLPPAATTPTGTTDTGSGTGTTGTGTTGTGATGTDTTGTDTSGTGTTGTGTTGTGTVGTGTPSTGTTGTETIGTGTSGTDTTGTGTTGTGTTGTGTGATTGTGTTPGTGTIGTTPGTGTVGTTPGTGTVGTTPGTGTVGTTPGTGTVGTTPGTGTVGTTPGTGTVGTTPGTGAIGTDTTGTGTTGTGTTGTGTGTTGTTGTGTTSTGTPATGTATPGTGTTIVI